MLILFRTKARGHKGITGNSPHFVLTVGNIRWLSSMRMTRFRCSEKESGGVNTGRVNVHANISHGIASNETRTDFDFMRWAYFGSAHAGVCNFVLGDGSVRGLPTTINVDVFAALGNVNSGEAVSVP